MAKTINHKLLAEANILVIGQVSNIGLQYWPHLLQGHFFFTIEVCKCYHIRDLSHEVDLALATKIKFEKLDLTDKLASPLVEVQQMVNS